MGVLKRSAFSFLLGVSGGLQSYQAPSGRVPSAEPTKVAVEAIDAGRARVSGARGPSCASRPLALAARVHALGCAAEQARCRDVADRRERTRRRR